MRLVYDKYPDIEVTPGDIVTLRDGEAEVTGIQKPHKPSSAGRVIVRYLDADDEDMSTRSYFPGVIDAHWIEREDQNWQ